MNREAVLTVMSLGVVLFSLVFWFNSKMDRRKYGKSVASLYQVVMMYRECASVCIELLRRKCELSAEEMEVVASIEEAVNRKID